MTRRLTLPTRAAWLEARQHGIGGSDAAAALGLSPFTTPLELFVDKLGLVEEPVESEAMRWGRVLEPLVADRYVEETGRTLAPPDEPYSTILVHPEFEWLRATIDREIVSAGGKDVPAVLEVKTTHAVKAEEWDEEPPVHVQIQGQHQLLVTGRAWVSFAVLIGGQQFRWCDMPRNDKFIAVLQERLGAFWRRVELNDPPPVTAEDQEVLAVLFPREKPETSVALPPEASTWDADREVAAIEMKKWERIKAVAEGRIKAAIGDAAYGVLPGGGRWAWKTIERAAVMQPAVSYRQLRRLKK